MMRSIHLSLLPCSGDTLRLLRGLRTKIHYFWDSTRVRAGEHGKWKKKKITKPKRLFSGKAARL